MFENYFSKGKIWWKWWFSAEFVINLVWQKPMLMIKVHLRREKRDLW